MSHLAEEYAKSCGVRIGKPVIKPHFFPVPFDKYITIHNDKKVQAKEYNFWPEVIELLKPHLGDIKIIQIGAFGEETIEGVDKHIPTFSLKQSSYIIQKSLGHVGIDSVPVHLASAFDKPVVGIYSHTYANTCDPLWNKKSKAITIESDRDGRRPSFALEENPKTINLIKPEKIAQAVLDVLEIDKKIKQETIYTGALKLFHRNQLISKVAQSQ
jgi:ADP-heptose:LPS heptosyltransferase